jgi:hypothetical protein
MLLPRDNRQLVARRWEASFTPDAPGKYIWVASYGGDPPNTTAWDPSVWNDAGEDVVVSQIPTEIKTKQGWTPNDTATITSRGRQATTWPVGPSRQPVRQPRLHGHRAVHPHQDAHGRSHYEEVTTTKTGDPNAGGFTITTGYGDAADSDKGP